jgi:hypothetical protein
MYSVLFKVFFKILSAVSGRLNVLKGVKQTNQIVGFGENRHMISL